MSRTSSMAGGIAGDTSGFGLTQPSIFSANKDKGGDLVAGDGQVGNEQVAEEGEEPPVTPLRQSSSYDFGSPSPLPVISKDAALKGQEEGKEQEADEKGGGGAGAVEGADIKELEKRGVIINKQGRSPMTNKFAVQAMRHPKEDILKPGAVVFVRCKGCRGIMKKMI